SNYRTFAFPLLLFSLAVIPGRYERGASVEVELLELAMFGLDVAHGAGDRAHHHRLGLDHVVLAELDAGQQRAGGDAGRREQAVAARHVLDAIDHARIVDAHLVGTLALFLAVEDQAALHLPADATQRHRRQHALRRAADADIHVHARLVGRRGVNDAGDVAIGDEAHGGPCRAYALDDVGVARPVEDQDRDRAGLDALGLGEPTH